MGLGAALLSGLKLTGGQPGGHGPAGCLPCWLGLSPFRKATLPSSSPSIRAELVIAGKAMAPRPVPKKAFGSAFGAGLPLIVMARAARKKSVTWGDLG